MRNSRLLSALALSAVMAGCATGPTVHIDKDPAVNMYTYKTFAFFDQLATDRAHYSTLTTARLKQATRTQMERLGYVYDERAPQLRVNFFLNIAARQEIRSTSPTGFYGYRAGFYRAWGGYPYNVETVTYKAGTLSVDLIDARTQSLVWQGVAEGRVSEKAVREPDTAIDAVVAEVFRKFPVAPWS